MCPAAECWEELVSGRGEWHLRATAVSVGATGTQGNLEKYHIAGGHHPTAVMLTSTLFCLMLTGGVAESCRQRGLCMQVTIPSEGAVPSDSPARVATHGYCLPDLRWGNSTAPCSVSEEWEMVGSEHCPSLQVDMNTLFPLSLDLGCWDGREERAGIC